MPFLQPLSCGTERGPITHSPARPEERLTSLHQKGDILAQVTIVKQLLCARIVLSV